ncbi:hypothetical protein CBL_06837 [Carabus blaptoides fortunei]
MVNFIHDMMMFLALMFGKSDRDVLHHLDSPDQIPCVGSEDILMSFIVTARENLLATGCQIKKKAYVTFATLTKTIRYVLARKPAGNPSNKMVDIPNRSYKEQKHT